jgi:hypothetical protein
VAGNPMVVMWSLIWFTIKALLFGLKTNGRIEYSDEFAATCAMGTTSCRSRKRRRKIINVLEN